MHLETTSNETDFDDDDDDDNDQIMKLRDCYSMKSFFIMEADILSLFCLNI